MTGRLGRAGLLLVALCLANTAAASEPVRSESRVTEEFRRPHRLVRIGRRVVGELTKFRKTTVRAGQHDAPMGYRILGDPKAKHAVALVPSSFFSHRQWDGIAKALRLVLPARYKILMFDYPGAALSGNLDPLAPDARMSLLVGKVFELIDHLALEELDLFGYSLGSDMAIALASDGKRRVRTVYDYATPFPSTEDDRFADNYRKSLEAFDRIFAKRKMDERIETIEDVNGIFRSFLQEEASKARWHRQLGRTVVRLFPGQKERYVEPRVRDALLRNKLTAHVTKNVLKGTRLGYVRSLLERFSKPEFWKSDVETLARSLRDFPEQIRLRLAVGENDDIAPPWMTAKVAELVDHAEVYTLKGGTHWSLSLNPIKMLKTARDFRRHVLKGRRFRGSELRRLRNVLKLTGSIDANRRALVDQAVAALDAGDPLRATRLAGEAGLRVPKQLAQEAADEIEWLKYHRGQTDSARVAAEP